MRFAIIFALLALAAGAGSTAAIASPTCEVNSRGGPYTTTRRLAEGVAYGTLAAGTKVEIITVEDDEEGCPWALVREPGQLATDLGWADRRHITCR